MASGEMNFAPRSRRRSGRVAAAAVAGLAAYDLVQRHHAILRNFPVVGHLRYLIEEVGPELRQYIVTSDEQERPFSRNQRRWVYASAKGQTNVFGFGSELDMETMESLTVLRQTPFPAAPPAAGETGSPPEYLLPCAKVLGETHGRRHAFRPQSVVNISGMSYGSLSPPAVEALARAASIAPCLHNTGEGGLATEHLHGADLIFQIGTGYFGCRDENGRFSLERLRDRIAEGPVRALEIKLSQGAKPGLGGMLPAPKVTPEIARIRGVRVGVDCISPPSHSAFKGVDGLIEWVEMLAEDTGLPVGIKAAVGDESFWVQLAERMSATGGGPDFITVDGAEGGTGAAPLAFTDHVALPFKLGFAHAFAHFARAGIADQVVWIGAGRLGFADAGAFAFSLGCDMVNVGREAMLAIGCIQALRCHTDRCPTGVATQNRWLMRGLDPDEKHARAAAYIRTLRGELLALSRAHGVRHPALLSPQQLEIVTGEYDTSPVAEVFGYEPEWRALSPERRAEIEALIGGGGKPPPPGLTPSDGAAPAEIGDTPSPLDRAPSPAPDAPDTSSVGDAPAPAERDR
jgi:glutamate synthase domain-containing protein 2